MTEVLRMSRKAMTSAIVVATIAWSIGLSALIAPMTAKAAVSSGMLVKGSLSAVYYIGSDMKRYVFPNEKTYFTWYPSFAGIVTITDAELASLAIGGNVTYRPGVKLVKIQSVPKVYAVAAHGVLRWVKTEALAVCLYGSDWNTADTHDIPDAFFTNYTIGADINSCGDFNPAAETAAATSINWDKNLSTGVSGSLSASLSSNQPAGGTLPKGANNVTVVKVDVRNGGATSMTVDSLVVHRSGAGSASDIANVYVYSGNDRLTTGRTVNSTTHDASFSGLNLVLAPGEMKTLSIAVDFSTTAASANVHSFSVTEIKSGSLMASGLPVSGPSFTISGASAGTVTISQSGTITNPKAGQLQAKLAEFQLAAGSTEDIRVSKIALFHGGTLSREKLSNFTLKQAGLTLATTPALNSKDLAVFVLSTPMLIEKGNTRTFEMYADIAGSARSGDTTKFYLEQTTDLLAVGATYGYGVGVISTAYDNSVGCGTDASCATVQAGQVTLSFNGPAAKDIVTNGKDVEVYNFTMAAGANIEVRNLRMRITAVGADDTADDEDLLNNLDSSGNYRDIKVIDTASGATIAGPKELVTTNAAIAHVDDEFQDLTFTETFNLSAGQSRTFKVTLDVANNPALAGQQVRIDLLPFQANDVRNLDNSTYLTPGSDIVPNSTISGNAHTIKTPTVTIGQASTPVQQTYIQGTQGAALAGFTLRAGDGADMRVTSIAVTGFVDEDGDGNASNGQQGCDTVSCAGANTVAGIVQTAKLMNGATQVGDTESPSSSTTQGTGGVITFDNLNLTVPAGQTLTLVLSGNLAGALSFLPDDVYFDIVNNSDVAVTDPQGNSVTATGAGDADGTNRQMTIKGEGSVTVALAPDDVESEASNVIGGSSNVVLAKYRFSATDEELKLTKVRMQVAVANTTSSLSLYDGAMLVGGPVSVDGNGNADFSNMNFVIPKDGSKVLTVKGNLNTVGSSGATSGSSATVTLKDDAGTFEVRGTSAGSSTLLDNGDLPGDIVAREKFVRRTKPTVAIVSLPSSTLTNSTMVLARFTVSADAAGPVALKGIKATLSESVTAAGTTFTTDADSSIRRVGDGSNVAGLSDLAGGACDSSSGTCAFTAEFTNEEVIAAGTSRTYDVRIVIGGTAVANGDAVSMQLLGDSTSFINGEIEGDGTTTQIDDFDVDGAGPDTDDATAPWNFIWSDMSAAGHNDVNGATDPGEDAAATNDWTNGRYVKNLPGDQQTVTK